MYRAIRSIAAGISDPTIASWLELIHPDDRQSAQDRNHRGHARAQPAAVPVSGGASRTARCATSPRWRRSSRIPSTAAHAWSASTSTSRERVEADERERNLQHQLRDASRRAGMAEIATNVLHNIGNVLNSVNISATLVSDRIKIAEGRRARQEWPRCCSSTRPTSGPFISTDERGKHLPAYLAQLSEQLTVEQGATLKELDLLRKNIDHIKEIVVMQQSLLEAGRRAGEARRREPRRRCVADECRSV